MTEQQAIELINLTADLVDQAELMVYLLYVISLGVGFLWGSLTWVIITYGLKARSILG